MAQEAKFHVEAVGVFGAKQTAPGVQAVLTSANALAALELEYSLGIESSAFKYLGDALSRDEETVITDTNATIKYKGFFPISGTVGGAVATQEWFEACGGAIISTPSVSVEITNRVASSALLTQSFRRSTADVTTQKEYKIWDAVGNCDLTLGIGARAMLDFTFLGNTQAPTQEPTLAASYGAQKTNVGATMRKDNLIHAKLTAEDGGTVYDVCFGSLEATNWMGFEFDRFLTGCEEGYSKGAVATDVKLTILEDTASAGKFIPEAELEKNFKREIKFGTGAGKFIEYTWDKIALATLGAGTLGKWTAQEITFRNRSWVSALLT